MTRLPGRRQRDGKVRRDPCASLIEIGAGDQDAAGTDVAGLEQEARAQAAKCLGLDRAGLMKGDQAAEIHRRASLEPGRNRAQHRRGKPCFEVLAVADPIVRVLARRGHSESEQEPQEQRGHQVHDDARAGRRLRVRRRAQLATEVGGVRVEEGQPLLERCDLCLPGGLLRPGDGQRLPAQGWNDFLDQGELPGGCRRSASGRPRSPAAVVCACSPVRNARYAAANASARSCATRGLGLA